MYKEESCLAYCLEVSLDLDLDNDNNEDLICWA